MPEEKEQKTQRKLCSVLRAKPGMYFCTACLKLGQAEQSHCCQVQRKRWLLLLLIFPASTEQYSVSKEPVTLSVVQGLCGHAALLTNREAGGGGYPYVKKSGMK